MVLTDSRVRNLQKTISLKKSNINIAVILSLLRVRFKILVLTYYTCVLYSHHQLPDQSHLYTYLVKRKCYSDHISTYYELDIRIMNELDIQICGGIVLECVFSSID